MVKARLVIVGLGAILIGVGLNASRADHSAAHAGRQQSKPSAQTRTAVTRSAQPSTQPAAAKKDAGKVVATARWGGAPDQLGRRAANESSPEGPMSFDADERGRLYVLDQVNSRVSVFEAGRAARSVKLPRDTFQDIALSKKGFVALDRFGSATVAFFDLAGNLTHEAPLVGAGVPTGGDVTGLFQRDDGTWVEVKHEGLVQIADSDGNPIDQERLSAPGRFAADGSFLRLSKSGATSAALASIDKSGTASALGRVDFPMRVWQLLALEPDAKGRIVIAAEVYEEAPEPPFDRLAAAEQVVVLDAKARVLERFELPVTDSAEESFRRVRVSADGTIHHMAFGDDGVTFRRLER